MKISLAPACLAVAMAWALSPGTARAQHAGHTAPPAQPPPVASPAPAANAVVAANAEQPVDLAAEAVDHAAMGHAIPSEPLHATGGAHHAPIPPAPAAQAPPRSSDRNAPGHPAHPGHVPAGDAIDHAAMGHDVPAAEVAPGRQGSDHAAMDHSGMEHAGMDHGEMGHGAAAPTRPREPIPPITEADRKAAFPDVAGHAVHDRAVNSFVLFNRLEAWDADPGTAYAWEGQGWIGGDIHRLWLRSEGERIDGHTESADLEVLYGRGIARWWDLVTGVRHDFKPGRSQTFAAIGVVGLAPQKFEVEATAYLGERGQTGARLEVEYELLLTNRLILQPLVELEAFGKDDPARGIGAGLSSAEAGLRLRYEFTRKFAPYVGVVHERVFGNTADLRRGEGEDVRDTRVVFGLRTWF